MKPFDQAWALLKMYREPENQEQIDYNQMIMRNPGGFDRRWCAMPDCHAFVARNSDYCIEHKNVVKMSWLSRLAGGAAGLGQGVKSLPTARQTRLYNFDPNMPSPHGPVKLYHGTHSGLKDEMMTQGLESDKMKRGKVYATDKPETADIYARSNATWENVNAGTAVLANQKKPQVFGIREGAGPGEPASHGVQPYRTFAGRVHPDLLVDMGESAGGAQSSLSSTNRIQGQ